MEAAVCVFVATRDSVASSWCGAELGAFWGAGKPVIIYIAEASLSEDEMPHQFRGHLFERRLSRVATSVQAYLAEHGATSDETHETQSVSSLSRAELQRIIVEALERFQDVGFVENTLNRFAEIVNRSALPGKDTVLDQWRQREADEYLTALLALRDAAVRQGAARSNWKWLFSFTTDTGDWTGCAMRYDSHPDDRAPIGWYRDCIIWRSDASHRLETVGFVSSVTDHDSAGIVGYTAPQLLLGRGELGNIRKTP